jgi:AcrR family transcriptional regulator
VPKIVDHDKRRSELLVKCETLFMEKGFAAVSMRALTDATGVSTGTLYHYFGSKEELFRMLVRSTLERLGAELMDVLSRGKTNRERLSFFVRYMSANEDLFVSQALVLADYARCAGLERFHQEFDFSPTLEARVQLFASLLGMSLEQARAFQTYLLGIHMSRFLEGKTGPIGAELTVAARLLGLQSDP